MGGRNGTAMVMPGAPEQELAGRTALLEITMRGRRLVQAVCPVHVDREQPGGCEFST